MIKSRKTYKRYIGRMYFSYEMGLPSVKIQLTHILLLVTMSILIKDVSGRMLKRQQVLIERNE